MLCVRTCTSAKRTHLVGGSKSLKLGGPPAPCRPILEGQRQIISFWDLIWELSRVTLPRSRDRSGNRVESQNYCDYGLLHLGRLLITGFYSRVMIRDWTPPKRGSRMPLKLAGGLSEIGDLFVGIVYFSGPPMFRIL